MRIFIKIFGVIIFFFVCSIGLSVDYYVDFASGVDTNNGLFSTSGTPPNGPFKHSPGDDNAEDTAAFTSLNGGDTVYFKGGVVYYGKVDLDWSGTNDSTRIVYDGNSAESWGSGKAIIDGQHVSGARGFITPSTKSYITIQYFEIRNLGGYAEHPGGDCSSPISTTRGGIAFLDYYGSSYITLKDLYIHDIGIWYNNAPFTSAALNGRGIYFKDADHILIDNVEITKVAVGIKISTLVATDNIEIKNSDIHNYVIWLIDVTVEANNRTVSNVFIHDNEIHDYTEHSQTNWTGCSEWPHTDGVFIRNNNNTGVTWTNINIYNNEFYSSGSGGGTAAIYLTDGSSANVYNNTFRTVGQGRSIAVHGKKSGETQVFKIYNNSFYDSNLMISLRDGHVDRSTYVENNVFYNTNGSRYAGIPIYLEDTVSDPDTLDYNQYYVVNGTNHVLRRGGFYTIGGLQSTFSWESNGQFGDPKYISSSDFHLESDSPCIDEGTDLGSDYDKDKDGIFRPKGTFWDMGAYEGFGRISKPENLRFQ